MFCDVSFISNENLFLKATFLVHTVGFFCVISDFVTPNEFNVFPFWIFLEHQPMFSKLAHDFCLNIVIQAAVAQLRERQTEDLKVLGSIPSVGIVKFWQLD